MTIGFRARAAGSLALTIGLVWVFTFGNNWLPIVPLGTGVVLYVAGVFGASEAVSQSRTYAILLLALSGIAALTSVASQISIGFVATDLIGQLLFFASLVWFSREPLARVQSSKK